MMSYCTACPPIRKKQGEKSKLKLLKKYKTGASPSLSILCVWNMSDEEQVTGDFPLSSMY